MAGELKITAELTIDELQKIREALDSHVYWQLSDQRYRDNGFVQDPGSDSPEVAEDIRRCNELRDRLEGVITAHQKKEVANT